MPEAETVKRKTQPQDFWGVQYFVLWPLHRSACHCKILKYVETGFEEIKSTKK